MRELGSGLVGVRVGSWWLGLGFRVGNSSWKARVGVGDLEFTVLAFGGLGLGLGVDGLGLGLRGLPLGLGLGLGLGI